MGLIQTHFGRNIALMLCIALPVQGFAAPAGPSAGQPLTVAALQERFPDARFIALDTQAFEGAESILRNATPSSGTHLQLVRNTDDLSSLPLPVPTATPARDCMPQTGVRAEGESSNAR
jgi:hypothetical protein